MSKKIHAKLEFKPRISRIVLNPEQAVLSCTCFSTDVVFEYPEGQIRTLHTTYPEGSPNPIHPSCIFNSFPKQMVYIEAFPEVTPGAKNYFYKGATQLS